MSRTRARDEPVRPQCPACASKYVRYRIRTTDFWCRRCGVVWVRTSRTGILIRAGTYPANKAKAGG